jgi:hypothetical protein
MTRRAKQLALSYAIVLAGVCVLLVIPAAEPRCQGKPLSEWLHIYTVTFGSSHPQQNNAAADAIRQIGTNALSWLLASIRQDPARMKLYRKLNCFPSLVETPVARRFFCQPSQRASEAILGFQILGRDALPAVPELRRIASGRTNSNDSPQAATRAKYVLVSIPEVAPQIDRATW